MKKVYDLAIKNGSYEKNGETKFKYLNVGCVMQSDKGMFILLEKTFNPAGVSIGSKDSTSVLISIFEPKNKLEESFSD